MSLPYIGISLISENKAEVLSVLQGVTRYIDTIYIQQKLFKNEGIDFLIFLNQRYPKKNVILDLSDMKIIDKKFESIIKKSKINEFVLSSNLPEKELEKGINILKKYKKEIILKGLKFDIDVLNKNDIKKIFFYKNKSKKELNFWKEIEIKNINKLIEQKFYVIVGDVLEETINQFDMMPIQELTVGKDVCYSFNPIKTCKNFSLLLKEIFSE